MLEVLRTGKGTFMVTMAALLFLQNYKNGYYFVLEKETADLN